MLRLLRFDDDVDDDDDDDNDDDKDGDDDRYRPAFKVERETVVKNVLFGGKF